MVRAIDGVTLYFDPQEIAQYRFLGYTNEQIPVYKLFYQDGSTEDMMDKYHVLAK